jgi:hypothetical protein
MSKAPRKMRVGKKSHYNNYQSSDPNRLLKNHKLLVSQAFNFENRIDRIDQVMNTDSGGPSTSQEPVPRASAPSTSAASNAGGELLVGEQEEAAAQIIPMFTTSSRYTSSSYQTDMMLIGDLCVTEKETFITIEKKCISKCFPSNLFANLLGTNNNLCFWQIFYDASNFEAAKKRAMHFYERGQLPGIKCISYPIQGSQEKPLLFFSGEYLDVPFMTYVGNMLVFQMNHVKQKCNKSYPNFIYCMRKGEKSQIKVPY